MSTQPDNDVPMQKILQQFSAAVYEQRIRFYDALGLAERQLIIAAMERNNNDLCAAAGSMNMTCATLRNRLKAYGMGRRKRREQ